MQFWAAEDAAEFRRASYRKTWHQFASAAYRQSLLEDIEVDGSTILDSDAVVRGAEACYRDCRNQIANHTLVFKLSPEPRVRPTQFERQ